MVDFSLEDDYSDYIKSRSDTAKLLQMEHLLHFYSNKCKETVYELHEPKPKKPRKKEIIRRLDDTVIWWTYEFAE